MFQSPVAPSADFAVDGAEAYGFPPSREGKLPLCCRIVLKNTLTAGGASVASLERRVPAAWSCGMEGARSGSNVSRSGALVRLCRTRAQASRPWIHAASRPCGTRADLVATNVAAQAGARPHATHNAVNTVLQQSQNYRIVPHISLQYHPVPRRLPTVLVLFYNTNMLH